MTVGPAALEDRILTGSDRRLQMAAARGDIDQFPRLRRVAIQVALTVDGDPEIAETASAALTGMPHLELADVLERSANRMVLGYFAEGSRDPVALETILRNPGADAGILRKVLPKLPESLWYLLRERADVLNEDPTLFDLLPPSAQRDFHLRGDGAPVEPVPEGLLAALGEAFDVENLDAEEESRRKSFSRELQNRLSEGQIRTLPVSARLKLCRGASRMLRGIMVRDPNPSVATAVLEFNMLADSEIESIAGNRNVPTEVLGEIVRDRRWPRKRSIALALVKNPKVATGSAVRLLGTLAVRELRAVSLDNGVPSVVRAQAKKQYNIKIS